MKLALWLWTAGHLVFVARCVSCRAADVTVLWPDRFATCPRCGAQVFAQPPWWPTDPDAEGDERR
jgi:hypothetical protein